MRLISVFHLKQIRFCRKWGKNVDHNKSQTQPSWIERWSEVFDKRGGLHCLIANRKTQRYLNCNTREYHNRSYGVGDYKKWPKKLRFVICKMTWGMMSLWCGSPMWKYDVADGMSYDIVAIEKVPKNRKFILLTHIDWDIWLMRTK